MATNDKKYFTKVSLEKKQNTFTLDVEWKEGVREGGFTNKLLHEVNDGLIVEMRFGGLEPLRVHGSLKAVTEHLKEKYGIEPELINCSI